MIAVLVSPNDGKKIESFLLFSFKKKQHRTQTKKKKPSAEAVQTLLLDSHDFPSKV
jgi:hypothetical protein